VTSRAVLVSRGMKVLQAAPAAYPYRSCESSHGANASRGRGAIDTNTRAAKRIGDFGEGLVTYALIRKGFEVARVDDVGADLIATRHGQRFAISVKARLFRPESKESHVTVIESDHVQKLRIFAERFGMVALLAQVICLADQGIIHLFVFQAEELDEVLPTVKNGHSVRFGSRHIEALSSHPAVDYSCWREQLAVSNWFGASSTATPLGTIVNGDLQ